ncbi:MAG: hypothetical protein ABR558_11655 [Thioalkalivibrio sp.]
MNRDWIGWWRRRIATPWSAGRDIGSRRWGCIDNEHQRLLEAAANPTGAKGNKSSSDATHSPFAGLKDLLKDREG